MKLSEAETIQDQLTVLSNRRWFKNHANDAAVRENCPPEQIVQADDPALSSFWDTTEQAQRTFQLFARPTMKAAAEYAKEQPTALLDEAIREAWCRLSIQHLGDVDSAEVDALREIRGAPVLDEVQPFDAERAYADAHLVWLWLPQEWQEDVPHPLAEISVWGRVGVVARAASIGWGGRPFVFRGWRTWPVTPSSPFWSCPNGATRHREQAILPEPLQAQLACAGIVGQGVAAFLGAQAVPGPILVRLVVRPTKAALLGGSVGHIAPGVLAFVVVVGLRLLGIVEAPEAVRDDSLGVGGGGGEQASGHNSACLHHVTPVVRAQRSGSPPVMPFTTRSRTLQTVGCGIPIARPRAAVLTCSCLAWASAK